MNSQAANRRVERLENVLPPIPALFAKLREVLAAPEASVIDAVRVIECDPAIAARVLRTANSARYAPASEVCSIRHAVMLMGIAAVGNTVIESGLMQAFSHLADDFDLETFWGHSLRTANACRELATLAHARHIDSEQAYATGLLHDVGQIGLANADPSAYGEVADASGGDETVLLEVEREAFGVDHPTYGAWILRSWQVPESLAVAVERHHHPELWADVEPLERLLRMHDRFDEAWMEGGAEQAQGTRENELMLLLDVSPDVYERHLARQLDLASSWSNRVL